MKYLFYVVTLTAIVVLGQAGVLLNAEILLIQAYQKVGSPVTRHLASCRYEPTCSNFAMTALREDGFWQGNLKIGARLVRCSPLGLLIPPGDEAVTAG